MPRAGVSSGGTGFPSSPISAHCAAPRSAPPSDTSRAFPCASGENRARETCDACDGDGRNKVMNDVRACSKKSRAISM